MNLSNSHKLLPLLAAICAVFVMGFVSLRFVQFERASYALPRLFIQLERSLGYDGFIHNFKNFILRPDEDGYLDAALEDYITAAATISEIEVQAARLGVQAEMTDVISTLATYREMLDTARVARREDLTTAEVDERVRVSDVDAARSIGEFEREILDVLARRRGILYSIAILCMFSVVAGALVIAYVQSKRRLQAENDKLKLEEQETFLLQAERIAQLGRWKTDSDGNLYWSQATGRICGLEPEEFPKTIEGAWAFVPAEDQAKVRVAVDKALKSKGQFSCLHRMQRPDGSMVNVVDSGEVILNPAGEVTGLVGTLQDVTRLVDMENELRQAQKMEAIGSLAGGMAHDFNNILAVIMGNLELLKATIQGPEQTVFVENALDATQRGADLTRNMLGFARRSHLEPTSLQANDLVRDVVNWSARLLPANIRIETSLLANLWQFTADAGMAKNALLNLMLNARDAMPDGGRLTIETGNIRIDDDYIADRGEDLLPGRYVMIAVSDTGTGIKEGDLKKVFDPFFTTKPLGQGTGLGLSMVQGFMKQSRGTVRIYSEPRVGTTLKLYFNAEPQSGMPLPQSVQTQDLSNLKGKRILLVEDNADLLTALEELLTRVGLDVTTARSGDDAMALWDNNRTFDVIVTDIVMPGNLQGTHLAKAIRAVDPSVAFVFMSGYANEAMVHGNGLRAEDIRLMKPVSQIDLLGSIATLIKKKD
ncbi:ATP-binding protein [Primorskyibacter sp. 2E233]|uniref:ATP-binding protein n=1 Tax=Primorskyibacter sp. 2E233 TaxID=3413431 RepID=UPI003BF42DD7